MATIGEALVTGLLARGVDTVFGIPGVHTVELYRGLAASGIRHVIPRHEQGAGFMADGYARASGKPGVAFVITGPGLTNTLTAMGQARADSVPMLVVSGVNALSTLGKGLGKLHELPDQRALARQVALVSERIEKADDLAPALDRAFAPFRSGRPGPTHIEIPLDVAGHEGPRDVAAVPPAVAAPDQGGVEAAIAVLSKATAPVILAGGGARHAAGRLRSLAERLGAPVVQTVNARGLMYAHPLGIPASPSLGPVRDLISGADAVLAVGTEFGETDYDMYATGEMAAMTNLIRVDICPEQLARHPAEIAIEGDAGAVLDALFRAMPVGGPAFHGPERAGEVRRRARRELPADLAGLVDVLDAIRNAARGALIVGDSAQPIYAGNLYYDHDVPGGWFNAATGFGALGYGIPAAIGAAVAVPGPRVICIAGDGGAQFSHPEIMTAVDENLPVTFVIWNNHGYQEIATSMEAAGVTVLGCDPTPPDFCAVAESYGIPFQSCDPLPATVAAAIAAMVRVRGPGMVEVRAQKHPALG